MSQLARIFIIWTLIITVGPVPLSGSFGLQQSTFSSLSVADQNSHPFVLPVATKTSSRAQKSRKTTSSMIQNLRFHKYPDHTRLVIDLKGHIHFKKRKTTKPERVVFELDRTRLSTKAYKKTQTKGFPQAVQLARQWNKPVTITLDLSALDKYKVLTLNNPNRLVLDLFPSSTPTPAKSKPAPPHPQVVKKPSNKPKTLTPIKKVSPTPARDPLLIVIDPGHGGKDPGALGRKGTREKDIVLKVSKQLKTMIAKRLNAKVLMTRDTDIFIELEDRAKFANSKKADLFVSIHVNSHPKQSVKGLEIYHFGKASDPRALEVSARENGTPLKDNGPAWQFILADVLADKKIDESRDLAWIARKALVGQLRKHYKIKDHGVKTAPFFVLRMTTMPSILAEIAFVSNPTEEKLIIGKTYQTRVAEGIFQGIKAYITPLQTVSR
ncbi:N-acetylmuramoyl-L-alanine amidase [Nitrospira sp. M1]